MNVEEQAEKYCQNLNREKVYREAAKDLEGYWVSEDDRIIHEGITEVNTDAISAKRFAFMKEKHDVEPKQFVMMVLDKARVVPLD